VLRAAADEVEGVRMKASIRVRTDANEDELVRSSRTVLTRLNAAVDVGAGGSAVAARENS
jgi:hypothetical protein